MRNAETVLEIIRERGRNGLPLSTTARPASGADAAQKSFNDSWPTSANYAGPSSRSRSITSGP